MVNHVVLFKLKDFPDKEKTLIRNELKSLLEGLPGKIDDLKFLEVGINHELNSGNFDLVLTSHFENIEALNRYRVHPEHVKILKRFAETTELRAAVDYHF